MGKSTKVESRGNLCVNRTFSGDGIDDSLQIHVCSSLPSAGLSHFIFSLILPLSCFCFLQFLSTSFSQNSVFIRGNSLEVEDNPSSEQQSLSCSRKTRWRERWQLSTLQIPAASGPHNLPPLPCFLTLCCHRGLCSSFITKTTSVGKCGWQHIQPKQERS